VVASDVSGIPEVVTDGRDGRLVKPANPEQLARCLRELAADPAGRAALGAAARARVTRDFSQAAMVDRHAALYRELAAETGRAAAGEDKEARCSDSGN
jgi:glycosyltransferase involved in cell wall biosynthesis